MGGLQAIIDGGYSNPGHDELETFFFYMYVAIAHEHNGTGPLVGDNFVEPLNYGSHPFLHAFSAHKKLLWGSSQTKKDILSGMISHVGKDGIPKMNRKGIRKFIWTRLLPLATGSTKKHLDAINIANSGFAVTKTLEKNLIQKNTQVMFSLK